MRSSRACVAASSTSPNEARAGSHRPGLVGKAHDVEALGGGTLAWDEVTKSVAPHIRLSVGLKEHSATAHTSHLIGATVQFLTEMIIVEVAEPSLRREKQKISTTFPCSGSATSWRRNSAVKGAASNSDPSGPGAAHARR
jgi:hypothetical protein